MVHFKQLAPPPNISTSQEFMGDKITAHKGANVPFFEMNVVFQ